MDCHHHHHGLNNNAYETEACLCHRGMLLNLAVDRIEALGAASLSRNDTAAGFGKKLGQQTGESISRALTARTYAKQIAKKNPERPVSAIAEAAWQGDERLMGGDSLNALAPKVSEFYGPVLSILTFANSHVVDTSDGLVMIDCGTRFAAPAIGKICRKRLPGKTLHTVIYTHGHIDHVSAQHTGYPEPFRVVAHENLPPRFDRYKKTNGYNTVINSRQFQLPPDIYKFPNEFRYPDVTYSDYHRFDVGGETFELYHGKGETDDATIVWMPKRRFLFCGDFFIWNAPNAGNPQKVQRFPEEWAQAARKILDLRPVIVFPGHGPPIIGEARCQEAFSNQATLLEGICTFTLEGINAGKSMGDIMRTVPVPQSLVSLPYLQPKYDDPRWFVASLWRRYAGWYTFDVRHLLPVSSTAVGSELAKIAGSADRLASHAKNILDSGDPERLGVALEIAEYAAAAAGASTETHRIRANILRAMEKRETSLMASSIYRAAASDSEAKL
jgi:glyoxylase-like metal-dependent hydrolase (beta-lactamase superfamily II)